MGIFKIQGKAERKIKYDVASIELEFVAKNKYQHIASKKVMDDCENFLLEVKKLGVKPDSFKLFSDRVYCNDYKDNELTRAKRVITIEVPYVVSFINSLRVLIDNSKYEVHFDVRPQLSNENAIFEELEKDAILDSKRKAEELAQMLNMKVIGISKLNIEASDEFYEGDEEEEISVVRHKLASSYDESDRLGVREEILYKSIDVYWNIE